MGFFPDETRPGDFQRKNFKLLLCLQKGRIFILDRAPHGLDYTLNNVKTIYSFTIAGSQGTKPGSVGVQVHRTEMCQTQACYGQVNKFIGFRKELPILTWKLWETLGYRSPIFYACLPLHSWWKSWSRHCLQSRVDGLQQPFCSHPAHTHTLPQLPFAKEQVGRWTPGSPANTFCAFIAVNPVPWKRKKFTGACQANKGIYVFLPRINFSAASSRNQPFKGTRSGCRAQISAFCWGCLRLSRICIKFSVLSDNITEKQNKSDHTVPIISCYSEVNLDFPN